MAMVSVSRSSGLPGVLVSRMTVAVADADTPGVVVVQSGGTTRLYEGGTTDTYTVRLTQAPTATVRVRITPTATETANGIDQATYANKIRTRVVSIATAGGSTTGVGTDTAGTSTSPPANWSTEYVVTLAAVTNADVEGTALQAFAPVARRANLVQGPLSVSAASTRPAYDLNLDNFTPVLMPGETSGHPLRPTLPTINVDEAAQVDTLVVHNEDDPSTESATVTSTRITGLGMAPDLVVAGRRFDGGITYSGLEALELWLGYGADTVTVESTHNGTTAIHGGRGNDTVVLKTVDGHTVVYGDEDDDTVKLGSGLAGTNGMSVEKIAALVAVDGGAGYDTVVVDDSGDKTGDLGVLTTLAHRDGHGLADGLDRVYRLSLGAGATKITFVIAGVGYVDVDVAG